MRWWIALSLAWSLTACIDGNASEELVDAVPPAPLDGGPCPGLDAHITAPCTEGRTCRHGPFCWGGREHFCPPGFDQIAEGTCQDGLYVGDAVPRRPPDPRCPPAADADCPDLLGLTCVYACGDGFRAQTCDGARFVDDWRSAGCPAP